MFLISWTGWTKEDWSDLGQNIIDFILFVILSPFLLIRRLAECVYNTIIYIQDSFSRRV